ncbi:unnamed protein product [Ilex paraguariensis]|uniref:Uncharacterized protein n=1 Tax=Ilex paraguariensis TaxID=185542 RepID=A0ABC8SRI4_9AQUA
MMTFTRLHWAKVGVRPTTPKHSPHDSKWARTPDTSSTRASKPWQEFPFLLVSGAPWTNQPSVVPNLFQSKFITNGGVENSTSAP